MCVAAPATRPRAVVSGRRGRRLLQRTWGVRCDSVLSRIPAGLVPGVGGAVPGPGRRAQPRAGKRPTRRSSRRTAGPCLSFISANGLLMPIRLSPGSVPLIPRARPRLLHAGLGRGLGPFFIIELLVHGWDLAIATWSPTSLAPPCQSSGRCTATCPHRRRIHRLGAVGTRGRSGPLLAFKARCRGGRQGVDPAICAGPIHKNSVAPSVAGAL